MTAEQLDLAALGEAQAAVSPGMPPGRGYVTVKRLLDVSLAFVALLLLAPLLAVVAVAVRLTSPGPALFRQLRVGKDGSTFTMLKFRSMRVDNDDSQHRAYVSQLLADDAPPDGGAVGVFKLVADPRVTGVGRWMRRTSIDELPQLLNVLVGHMSLVGPRPALPWEVEMYEPHHRRRLLVKPGVTGLWQVSGRSALTMRQALDLDVDYVARRGLSLDLLILVLTVPALLGHSVAA